jgi:predicted permease
MAPVPWIESWWRDVRHALRSLARDPGLTLVAVLTVALGIGATTAVFSVVNAILLRPLPIPGVDDLVSIQEERSGTVSTGVEGMRIPYARYTEYQRATADVFASLSAYRLDEFSLRTADATVSVPGGLTSGDFFATLGVRPSPGRAYATDDAAEIVISHDLWRTRFGGDPDAVGRIVRVDGVAVTIVGVAPPGFRGASGLADQVWVPAGVRGADQGSWGMRVVPIGRLAAGVTRERARAAVESAATAIPPEEGSTVRRARLDPVAAVPAQARGAVTGFLGMLFGMALLVLLIAAANIAGVLLARALARRREIAVRLALGAGRARVVRQMLAESMVIFLAGGAAGVALAYLGTGWLARMPLPPQVPVVLDLAPDAGVLAFALVLTAMTGLAFGLVPALQASRAGVLDDLKAGGHGAVAAGGRVRNLFVGGQVALAVMLLLTAGLFARSLQSGLRADVGFEADGVVVARLDLGPPHAYDPERLQAFFSHLVERVSVLPGVEAAGLANIVFLSGERSGSNILRPDAPELPGVNAFFDVVDPTFFETVGVELVAGRGFTDRDALGSTPVAVVNQIVAERLWPGESPLGRRAHANGEVEIVGVVRTGRYVMVTETPSPAVFLAFAQSPRWAMALHARAPGREAATLRAIQEEVRALDPDVALEAPSTLEGLVGFALVPQRVAAQFVGLFGVVGLVLAAMGIYGVLAYQVARRTREFGVRRALGATSGHVIRHVVGRGALIAGVGCALGTAAGAGLALSIRTFLYGIQPLDPLTFIGVPAALFGVALVAGYLPALRASTVEAVEALRQE